jgi:hypothetical protein
MKQTDRIIRKSQWLAFETLKKIFIQDYVITLVGYNFAAMLQLTMTSRDFVESAPGFDIVLPFVVLC